MRIIWILLVAVSRLLHAADAAPMDGPQIERLIRDLSADSFDTREEASLRFADAPARWLEPIRTAAKSARDPEVTQRLHRAVREIFFSRVIHRLPQLKAPGYVGIDWTVLDPGPGIVLNYIYSESSAARAGLKEGDVILQFGTHRFEAGTTEDQVNNVWRNCSADEVVTVKLLRNGVEQTVSITVGTMITSHQEYEARVAFRKERLYDQFLKNEIQIPQAVLAEDTPKPQKSEPKKD